MTHSGSFQLALLGYAFYIDSIVQKSIFKVSVSPEFGAQKTFPTSRHDTHS